MKIKLNCGACVVDFMLKKIPHPGICHLYITDDNVYNFKCDRGHNNIYVSNNLKSAIIFESGLCAMYDHYLREAVSSFYAALENFYSESIYLFYHLSGKIIDDTKFSDTYRRNLKLTERKLGSYYSLYLLLMNEVPEQLPDRLVNLRNNVMHGSHYPTLEETLSMANGVCDYIYKTMSKIEDKYPNAFLEMQNIIFKRTMKSLEDRDVMTGNHSFYLTYYFQAGDKRPDLSKHKPIGKELY